LFSSIINGNCLVMKSLKLSMSDLTKLFSSKYLLINSLEFMASPLVYRIMFFLLLGFFFQFV